MAQTKVKLDTKSNRARLPSRNGLAPYFERIGEGAYIGFRPSVRRDGDKWVICNGEFTDPVDVDGLSACIPMEKRRALASVQEPQLCQ